MRRGIVALGLVAALAVVVGAAAPPVPRGKVTREQVAWLNKSKLEINEHAEAGRFEEAEKLSRERVALLERVLGRGNRHAVDERYQTERWQRLTKVPRKEWEAVGRAIALSAQGVQLHAGGKYTDALKLFRDALSIREKALGEA